MRCVDKLLGAGKRFDGIVFDVMWDLGGEGKPLGVGLCFIRVGGLVKEMDLGCLEGVVGAVS